MANSSEQINLVIGVDTHQDAYTAAVVDRTGIAHAIITCITKLGGYQQFFNIGHQ